MVNSSTRYVAGLVLAQASILSKVWLI